MAWRHVSTPRRGSGPFWVALGLVGLGVLMAIGAHWAWRVVLALPLAWAVMELVVNTPTELTLDAHGLAWSRGDKRDRFPYETMEKVVLHRRMDLSTVATLHLAGGTRRRLPPNCAPPYHAFGAALQEHGVQTELRVFSLL